MFPFTLDQLTTLDAIARSGSFAAAAKELHKVPSAVSYNIQGLESALGVALFDRSGRRAVLTRAGRRLLDASRDVLERAGAMEQVAAQLRDDWEPELHVVVDGALPMAPVMRCIRRFAEPDVPTRLRVDVEYQEGVMAVFDAIPADLALMLGFDQEAEKAGYDCRPLPPLEFLLVAAAAHPLATGSVTDERRGQHAELVVRDSSPRFARESKRSFIGSRNVVFLSDFHSKRLALLEAAGYGWIARHFIEEDLEAGRLHILAAELSSWTYAPFIVTRAGEHESRARRLFLDTLGGRIS